MDREYKQVGTKTLADIQRAHDEMWKNGEPPAKDEKDDAVQQKKRVYLPRKANRTWRGSTFS